MVKKSSASTISDSKGDSLNDAKLDRQFGLLGATSLVVGGVIGMGIYALISAVGAHAGNAMWLA